MPREVVPILRSPRRASLSTSSSRWYGRIRWARSLISSRPSTSMPRPFELVHLGEERRRIDDHAVADHAGDARVQDARRNQVQDELLAADVDRVAGVVAALVAAHDREMRRQQIDDLALAFVAPLGAQHGDVHVTAIRAGGAFLRAGARPSAGHNSLVQPLAPGAMTSRDEFAYAARMIVLDGQTPDARSDRRGRRRRAGRARRRRARARSSRPAPSSIAPPTATRRSTASTPASARSRRRASTAPTSTPCR